MLPPLRQDEAEKSAAHHRLIVQREQLDAEEARAREAAQRFRQLIAQGEADIDREKELDQDAGSGAGRRLPTNARPWNRPAPRAAVRYRRRRSALRGAEREAGGSRTAAGKAHRRTVRLERQQGQP